MTRNMASTILMICAFSAFAVTIHAIEKPIYVMPCSRSDPDINNCIKKSFNYLKPFLSNGLTELDVPSLEPLKIDLLTMENDAGAVRIKALFSDIIVNGASNYTVKEVRSDVKKLRIDLRIGIPRVECRGKYEVIGNVLLLPVRSIGEFWAEFSEISAIAKVHGKETSRNGDMYMEIDKLGIDFTMKNARFKVKDTLSNGSVLGEAINQFLNTNSKELIQEMRPAASQSIGKLFKTILNTAFSRIPINQWLLE